MEAPTTDRDGRAAESSFARPFLFEEEVEREVADSRKRVLGEIERLGLQKHAWELEVNGYTVLEPKEVASVDFIDELRSTSVTLAEKRLGHSLDIEAGSTHGAFSTPFGQVQYEGAVLFEDPIFEQALMNEAALALITYLLGESCVLINELALMVKGSGPDHLPLHTDQDQAVGPAPFPPFAQVANATWALTDYSLENGPICFVSGSHKLCRPPTRYEATDLSRFEPLEIAAGSIVVWHGNTWHGALRRTAPGLRISLVEFFGRCMQRPTPAPPEVLNRNSPRLATLLNIAGAGGNVSALNEVKIRAAKTSQYA